MTEFGEFVAAPEDDRIGLTGCRNLLCLGLAVSTIGALSALLGGDSYRLPSTLDGTSFVLGFLTCACVIPFLWRRR